MNKLQKTLDAVMAEFGSDTSPTTDEVLTSTDSIINHAEHIGVGLCLEEAELVSKAGLSWLDSYGSGASDWSQCRAAAIQELAAY